MEAPEQPYTVGLTDLARADLDRITQYLRAQWTSAVATDFLAGIARRLELLTRFPFAGPESTRYPGLRQLVIDRRVVLHYRVHDHRVTVITIRDTREGFAPR